MRLKKQAIATSSSARNLVHRQTFSSAFCQLQTRSNYRAETCNTQHKQSSLNTKPTHKKSSTTMLQSQYKRLNTFYSDPEPAFCFQPKFVSTTKTKTVMSRVKTNTHKLSWATQDFSELQNYIGNKQTNILKNHGRVQTQPSCFSVNRCKMRQTKKEIESPMESWAYRQSCQVIDQIYEKINIVKQIGYSQGKISEWIQAYCENKCLPLRSILMRDSNKRCFTSQNQSMYENNAEKAKLKAAYKIDRGRGTLGYIKLHELQQVQIFFDDIISQKHVKKARELQGAILQKLSPNVVSHLQDKKCVFTKKQPIEVINFLSDLQSYEERYGYFKSFNKINKQRFMQLNNIQQHLKETFQDMLMFQRNKLVKKQAQQLITETSD